MSIRSHLGPVGLVPAIFFLALWLAGPSEVLAHGVSWSLSSQKTYGLEFTFDDGTPMAYVEVKVFRPGEAEALSQLGRTDKNGYFAFIPDEDGQWTVKADDGTGHLAQAQVNVSRAASENAAAGPSVEAAAMETERAVAKAAKPLKIALVISVFLNLAALTTLLRRKKA